MRNKEDDAFLSCLPWGRKKRETSAPRSRPKARPVSAVVAATSKARSTAKSAPEPAPVQWRSQAGASETSSTVSVRQGASDSGGKLSYISATAFPSESDGKPLGAPGARTSATHQSYKHISAASSGTTNQGAGAASPEAFAADGAYREPPSGPPLDRLDPTSRLLELQERHRLRSRGGDGGTRGSTLVDDRLQNDQIQCDSFSYNASVHARQPADMHARLTPLPPLLAGGVLVAAGGGGGGGGVEARKADLSVSVSDKKPLPLMHSPVHSRTNSVTTAGIPGSLPSMTQPSPVTLKAHATSVAWGTGPSSPGATRPGSGGPGSGGPGSGGLDSPGRHSRFAAQLRSKEPTELQVVGREPRVSGGGGGGGAWVVGSEQQQQQQQQQQDGFSFPARWQPAAAKPSVVVRASREATPPGVREHNRISASGGGGGGGGGGDGSNHSVQGPGSYSSLAPAPAAVVGMRPLAKLPSGTAYVSDSRLPSSSALGAEVVAGPEREGGMSPSAAARSDRLAVGPPRAFTGELLAPAVRPTATTSLPAAAPAFAVYGAPGAAPPSPRLSLGGAPEQQRATHAQAWKQPSLVDEPEQPQQQQDRYQAPVFHRVESRQDRVDPAPRSLDKQLSGLRSLDKQPSGLRSLDKQPSGRRSLDKQPSGLRSRSSAGDVTDGFNGGDGGGGRPDEYRPLTGVSFQRKEAAMANEAMLESLLSGKRTFDFASTKVGPGGTAEELERFDRVQDAMSRLEDILAPPPQPTNRLLNARAGTHENAANDFVGSSPAANKTSMGVRRW